MGLEFAVFNKIVQSTFLHGPMLETQIKDSLATILFSVNSAYTTTTFQAPSFFKNFLINVYLSRDSACASRSVLLSHLYTAPLSSLLFSNNS